ncbi:ABC transporter permease [Massilia agilis]|uniref:ABC transporter permease n=1 Tax=Massilia agilis TaxID=1811226 RepID=A0ABT2DCS2_9BURK|nr:ABC transporter permease [Massilia agilis]MCS0809077.1 ABC transporter permease [Massilia agilis]
MNLRDFRIGWRLLLKEPAYTAVVILGLAVGFAACFLLLGYVRHSLSYDQQVPERESIYRIKQRWNLSAFGGAWYDYTSLKAREAAVASGQPLLATTFFDTGVDVRVGEQVQSIGVTMVDPDFEKIFAPRVLAGNLGATLLRPDGLVLARETAVKLFGTADAVGRTLQSGGQAYAVGAIVADQPAATTMPFDALAGPKTTLWPAEDRQLIERNWGSSRGRVYVKLLPGADQHALLDALQRALRDSPMAREQSPDQVAALNGRELLDFKLGALADAYLDPDLQDSSSLHGDRQTIYGLLAVAVLILLLAATNYVNLATVRTLRRQREIAVRKVLGASAPTVVRQFLAESVLVCLIATLAGLLLAWLVLPVFADLVQRKLDTMFSPAALAGCLLLGVLLGLAAGAYPTWSALGVRPTAALAGRGNAETPGGLWMRRVLTVLQFATAMGLTGTTLAVAWQTHFASTLSPGFDPDPLLLVKTAKDMRDPTVRAFRDALARLPGVAGVAESDMPMTVSANSSSLAREGGTSAEINTYLVSPEFPDVYRIQSLAGRLYNPAMDHIGDRDRVVINASAAAKFGFASPQDAIGKVLSSPNGHEKPMQVIGVMPDLRHRLARGAAQPSVFYLGTRLGTLTVRVSGDMAAVQRAIEQMWPRYFPNDLLDMRRMRAMIEARYADDLRLAKLLAASSVIAIAIAAFGIYVLAAYSVQRKTKEIVLRKLYGASGGDIGALVVREFAMLTGIGALIGLPAAWLATERYLASFTERAPIGLWALGAALAVALAVALGATLRHTLAAVRVTPVLALRD